MKARVLAAFLRTRNGYSPDAVIADPALNAQFLSACRELGVEGADSELNHCLYNLRKSGSLQEHPTTHRVSLRDQDEYEFAAEIAARFLEREQNTTLDRIICDPALAKRFDRLAQELAPGFTPFEYRFTALSLRKGRRLRPEVGPHLLPAVRVESFSVAALDADQIPRSQGIYLFYYRNAGLLYVGEAQNLRDRIRKNLDHSDSRELAQWLVSERGMGIITLGLIVSLPAGVLGVAGLVCLVYAFWVRFRAERQGAA